PGVVKRGSANQMAKYMVSENEIRRPDTPLGRAKKMSDALDRGLDEDDIAVLFGCSVQTVRATLSLLDATQAVREAVEAGTVTVTQARQLGALPPEEQRTKVAEIELATAGTKGHEKSRRQRQILGEAKPRIKSRKEIAKALEDASGEYAEALRWVLGEAV
ncbi:ParB/RepB/Spo0J family partition protein, partial [Klebsiella pneumoniae]